MLPSSDLPLPKPKAVSLLAAKKVTPQLTKEPNRPQEVRTAELWPSSCTRGGSNFVLTSIWCCTELGEKPAEVTKRESYLRELAQNKLTKLRQPRLTVHWSKFGRPAFVF